MSLLSIPFHSIPFPLAILSGDIVQISDKIIPRSNIYDIWFSNLLSGIEAITLLKDINLWSI